MDGTVAMVMGGPFLGPNIHVLQASITNSLGETLGISALASVEGDPISQ